MGEESPVNAIKTAGDLLISWSGDAETFKRHSTTIVSALGDGSLTWENDRNRPPSTLNFAVKFVELDGESDSKLGISGDGAASCHLPVFLHLYFLCVESHEEYRQIRSQASEWFARLCEAGNQNWLIILDSSKAKERKARSSMVDKVRGDFARSSHKVVEVNDFSAGSSLLSTGRANTGSSSLPTHIQSVILESLASYKDSLSNEIANMEAQWKKCANEFQPTRLLNVRFQLCNFYWALALVEQCLEELASMGEFVHSFLVNEESATRSAAALSLFDETLPLIGQAIHRDHLEPDGSIADWRCFIVAHQIRANVHLLNHRLGALKALHTGSDTSHTTSSTSSLSAAAAERDQSPRRSHKSVSPEARRPKSGEETTVTAQHMRRDMASFILKQLLDTFHSLVEEVSIAQTTGYNPSQLDFLRILWFEEVMALCQCNSLPIGELASEEPVGHFYMLLLSQAKCSSLANLCASIVVEGGEEVLASCARWLAQEGAAPSLESSKGVLAKMSKAFSGRSKFRELAEKWLVDSRQLFRKRHWGGHVRLVNDSLVKLYPPAATGSDQKRFECLVENWRLCLELDTKAIGAEAPTRSRHVAHLLSGNYDELLTKDKKLHVDLLLSAALLWSRNEVYVEKLEHMLSTLSETITISNTRWELAPSVAFPIRVVTISGSLTAAFLLHSTITLEMRIETDLPGSVFSRRAEVVAVYRRLHLGEAGSFTHPLFESSTQLVATGKAGGTPALRAAIGVATKRHAGPISADTTSGNEDGECILLRTTSVDFKSPIRLEGKASYTGCYALCRIELRLLNCLVFSLDYAFDAAESTRKPGSVHFLVESKKPVVELEAVATGQKSTALYAGVVQQVRLRISFGSQAAKEYTELKMAQIAAKPSIEFLLADGKWASDGVYSIPNTGDQDDSYSLSVFLFMPIEWMNLPAEQEAQKSRKEIEVEWMGHQWRFPLSFTPIMILKSSTSLLGDRVLFELQVQRGSDPYGGENLVPLRAELHQDQSVAKDPVEAVLLNPRPFEPIRANSTYQLTWQLPTSRIGKTIPITHFIHLKYRVERRRSERMARDEPDAEFLDELVGRDYVFDNKLSFAVQKVEYEICAHVLSDRPQLVLCRVDAACDLIVSLRSLTSQRAESIVVVVEVDQDHWSTVDRFKVVNIKESGVGQTNFSIVPKRAGFLPYPLIYVHRQTPTDGHNVGCWERHSLPSEANMFGERLTSFHRNQGKQIHVLAHLSTGDDASGGSIGGASTGSSQPSSSKKSLKTQAKDKIHAVQKLFE